MSGVGRHAFAAASMTTSRQPPRQGPLLLGLFGLFRQSLDTARRVLPRPVKRPLARLARAADSMLAPRTQWRFDTRTIALADWKPIFRAAEFAAGPIILANNALAPGGTERQVVNTLWGLAQQNHSAGLLCLSLHQDPELDFFLPALTGFPGFIRNVKPAAAALAILRSRISAADCARMQAATAWMPPDVQIDVLRFAAEFASLKPSVVHAWQDSTNVAAGYGAWLVGVPRILVSCRSLAPTNFAYFRAYMSHGYRELASCAPIVMTSNSEAGAHDYARWLDLPVGRFVIRRNGIDTHASVRPAPHRTAALRAELEIPADAKIVGSIFRFTAEKRPLLWIKTAAHLSKQRTDCHFVIFGEGPLKTQAHATAKRHGFAGRLHLPGNIEDSSLGLSLFDVFLLTSKIEGTPNVVLEATLLGIPTVATDAGGVREAVADDLTGRVIAGADANELARQVTAVLDDPAWQARVKTHGPAFVERRFGLARMLEETWKLYRN